MLLIQENNTLKGLDALKNEAVEFIPNERLLSLAHSQASGRFTGVIENDGTWGDIQKARKFAIPNAQYGYRYGKNVTAVWNLRKEAGMDLFCTDNSGLLKNSLEHKNSDERIFEAQRDSLPVIYFFGGSTGMSMGARTPDFSIPALIEKIMLQKYKKKVVCINFSLGGTDCQDALNLLLFDALRLAKPDLVIFYDGWNCCAYRTQILSFCAHYKEDDAVPYYRGEGARQMEHSYFLRNMFNLAWVAERSRKLKKAFSSEKERGIVRRLSKRLLRRIAPRQRAAAHSNLHPGLEFWRSVEIPALNESEMTRIASDAAKDYLFVHARAQDLCEGSGIHYQAFLQPLVFWGEKPLTPQERSWKETGYSSGDPRLYYAFKEALSSPELVQLAEKQKLRIHDLTNSFQLCTAEIYIDSGHINRLGNLIVANNIAHTINQGL